MLALLLLCSVVENLSIKKTTLRNLYNEHAIYIQFTNSYYASNFIDFKYENTTYNMPFLLI